MFEEKKMDSKMLIIPSRKKNVGEAKIQQQSFQTYLWMNNYQEMIWRKKIGNFHNFSYSFFSNSGHQQEMEKQFFLKSKRAADRNGKSDACPRQLLCFVKGNRIVKIFRSFASDTRQQHLG